MVNKKKAAVERRLVNASEMMLMFAFIGLICHLTVSSSNALVTHYDDPTIFPTAVVLASFVLHGLQRKKKYRAASLVQLLLCPSLPSANAEYQVGTFYL